MKKTVLSILLLLLLPSASTANTATTQLSFRDVGSKCHVFSRFIFYNSGTCELHDTGEHLVAIFNSCINGTYEWHGPGGPAYPNEDSVGGCNGGNAYFDTLECTSSVYTDAADFNTQFPNKNEWWYFTSTVNGSGTYKCMSSYNNAGVNTNHRVSDYHDVDPTTSADCVSEEAFAALQNYTNDLSNPDSCNLQPPAYNTGISTTAGDPDSTYACGHSDPGCDVTATPNPDGEFGGEGTGCGAPVWEVNMVNMNLFVTDTPMWHNPPIGPSVKIQLSYNSQANVVTGAPFGNKWVFSYSSFLSEDITSSIVTVYMPDGREDVYTPDGGIGYTSEVGVLNVLTKTASNDFQVEFPDGTIYVYNRASIADSSQTLLTEIKDAYGQKLTLTYDVGTDWMNKITDAAGKNYTLIDTGSDGLVDRIDDDFGRSASFIYVNNKLTKITDMGGYWAEFIYDANSYLTSITNNNGETWGFKIEPSDGTINGSNPYPAPGELMGNNYRITITDPLNNKEEYYYYGPYSWYVSPRDYIIYTDADNNNYASAPKTIYYLDRGTGNGKIGRIVTPEGGRTDYRNFDPVSGKPGKIKDFHGNAVAHTDDRHTIEYTYNSKGFIASSKDAKGNVVTYEYFPNAIDVQTIKLDLVATPGNDNITLKTFTYNGTTHDVETATDRLSIMTEFLYNAFGQIITITQAKNSGVDMTTEMVYDAGTYEFTTIKKNTNIITSYTYDTNDRIETYTDDKGIMLTYGYDDLDRVETVTWPDANTETIAYSTCCPHLIASKIDRAGLSTTYTYDELKRLKTVQGPAGTVKYEYDTNGNRTKLIDKDGKETLFAYDLDNRLTGKTYADSKSETYTYDLAGLLTQIKSIPSNIEKNYTAYDKNHNILTVDYSDTTPDVTYTYDNYDRMETMTDGIGIYTYGYDDINRLTSIDGPWADDDITYQYNELSQITKMTAMTGPATSSVTDYYYDYDTGYADLDLGRLKEIQAGGNTYTYGYTGVNPLVQSLARPNSSLTLYTHNVDPLKRLTTIDNQHSTTGTINKHAFTYTDKDVIGAEQITTGTALDSFTDVMQEYTYNNVNQLTSATNPLQTFLYDDDGNMTQGYTPAGYQFTATYDAENRLGTLTYTDTSTSIVHLSEYYYSGNSMLARIIKKEHGSPVSTTNFVRAGFLPIQERDDTNTVTREYTWGLDKGGGIGGLLSLKEGGSDYYYLYDGKGNVMAVLASDQDVVVSYRYDEFGNRIKKTGTFNQPFQFSTKRYDELTGLSYSGYRFYSPMIGRWMTRDPLGEALGINLYGFVGNNALNYYDPFGLARIGSRPLDLLLPFNGRGRLRHDQIWYDDDTNSGFFDDDSIRSDRGPNRSDYDFSRDQYHYDDTLTRKAEKNVQKKWDMDWRMPLYNPWDWNNCQDYIEAVIEEYTRLRDVRNMNNQLCEE